MSLSSDYLGLYYPAFVIVLVASQLIPIPARTKSTHTQVNLYWHSQCTNKG